MGQPQHLIKLLGEERERGVIVWMLNIGAEKYWNAVHAGVSDRNENRVVARMEEMNILLCREQDVLILREYPDELYIRTLRELGFSIPTILTPNVSDPYKEISQLILEDNRLIAELRSLVSLHDEVWFVPYAVTRLEEEIAERCGLSLIASESAVNARINDKIANRMLAEQLGLAVSPGKACSSIEEVGDEYWRLTSGTEPFSKVVIKDPYGASGKGLYIIDNPQKLMPVLAGLKRFARNRPDAAWLVEGWQSKLADVSYQLYISPEGEVEVFSIKEQVLRDTVYVGSRMPPDMSGEWLEAYRTFGEKIGRRLFEAGFYGVAGIDSIVTQDRVIIPIVEINGRFTLSTYLSFISRTLGNKKYYARYYRMATSAPLPYGKLCSELDSEGLLLTKARSEGVLVYTAGTLPIESDSHGEMYTGRAFTLIAADSWLRVNEISERLDRFMDSLSANRLVRQQ